MTTAIVLGGGMVGSVIAADLAADPAFEVTIADRAEPALRTAAERAGGAVRTVTADLADRRTLARLVEPFDVVVGALASSIGYAALETVIDAGRNYCDICFMPEDAWRLDERAAARGVTAVVDCGVAPGMSNLLAAWGRSQLDRCDSIAIYVGGLPQRRRFPFEYKAAFSPHDVVEEYLRPARLVEGGRVVTRPALSDPELLEFAELGTLEAFNTDGLRSLTETLDVPFMKEKTMRYPGHRDLMLALREAGLLSGEPVRVGDSIVRPVDLFSAVVFPQWQYQPGEIDLTIMRVDVEGEQGGEPRRLRWELLDYLDPVTGFTSMARTTAFPAAIVTRLIANGAFKRPGVCAPEAIGANDGLSRHVISELAQRGVIVREG